VTLHLRGGGKKVHLRFRRFPLVLLVEVMYMIGINFYVTLEWLHFTTILI
jgi:hypothetical protein